MNQEQSIADQVGKLAKLRSDGILSDEEFAELKSALFAKTGVSAGLSDQEISRRGALDRGTISSGAHDIAKAGLFAQTDCQSDKNGVDGGGKQTPAQGSVRSGSAIDWKSLGSAAIVVTIAGVAIWFFANGGLNLLTGLPIEVVLYNQSTTVEVRNVGDAEIAIRDIQINGRPECARFPQIFAERMSAEEAHRMWMNKLVCKKGGKYHVGTAPMGQPQTPGEMISTVAMAPVLQALFAQCLMGGLKEREMAFDISPGTRLGVGDRERWGSGCPVVSVEIVTDRGSATYRFSNR